MKVQDRTPERLGPYRLLRRLGEGGMGVVYLAMDESGQPVAVKALHPQMAQEGNARRRLAREVETMRRVRSRYVAEVVNADLSAEPPYIVTRYVPGLTLDDVVSTGGPLTGQALARLACGLAQALAAIHAAEVVHRDLKPGNVMLCDGEPVVIDFGIAQMPETTRLTMTGMFMGTPGYLAPEVIEGKDSGPASDVHSLGATLAFAATGRPPFGTGTFEGIFFRIMHGQPDLDTLPASLAPVVQAALARDPAARPTAAQLGQWVSSLDPATLVPSPPSAPGAFGAGPGMRPALNGMQGGPFVPGPGLAGLPSTLTDGPAPVAVRPATMPLPTQLPDDFRDLLPAAAGPPVAAIAAIPAGAGGAPGQVQPGSGFGGGWQAGDPMAAADRAAAPRADGPDAAGRADRSRAAPVSAWSPLVIAVIAVAAAASVMAPIFGTALALALLTALRAVAATSRRMTRRRSSDGPRPSDPVVAAAFYPLALVRSLFGLILMSPVALLGLCIAAAVTIVLVPVHPLPEALAFGAGALVALIGLGPGSAGSRMVLANAFTSVTRSPASRIIAYVGVIAIAAWAGLHAWSQSQAPAYWPVTSLHAQLAHLPGIRSTLTDVRQSLLRLAHHIGL
jgi:hypothetical protein